MQVFFSYRRSDRAACEPVLAALRAAGLEVWLDEQRVDEGASITREVRAGMRASRLLLAWYSRAYPTSRFCQWELTAAFLAGQRDGFVPGQREGDPARRVRVINPEPTADHIQPVELRDARYLLPSDPAAVAAHVLAAAAALRGELGDLVDADGPRHVVDGPTGSARFVGRLADLWQVHDQLRGSEAVMVTGRANRQAMLVGMPGVGKTLLSEEYSLRFGGGWPAGVYWLRGGGPEAAGEVEGARHRIAGELQRLALALGLPEARQGAAEARAALVAHLDRSPQRYLWVVDDLPARLPAEVVRAWLAPTPQGRTLFTTRSRRYGALAGQVDVGLLPDDEALALLTRACPPHGEAEATAARQVAGALGGLALALDVAASAVVPLGGYARLLDWLRREDQDALELAAELADELPTGHERSVSRTLLGAVERLPAPGRDLLCLAAGLAEAPLPRALIEDGFRADALEEAAAARGQAAVLGASLAEEQADGLVVHGLVRRVVARRWPERVEALQAAAGGALLAALREPLKDIRRHREIEARVPHAAHVSTARSGAMGQTLAHRLGWFHSVRGAYAEAARWRREELRLARELGGNSHPHTLIAMGNLAHTLRALGDLAAARPLAEEHLRLSRQHRGDTHPDTLIAMGNLATTLYALGDLAAARPLEEERLRLSRQHLGDRHPHTTVAAWNLLRTLQDLAQPLPPDLPPLLTWLAAAAPSTLGADQQAVRGMVRRQLAAGRLPCP